MVTRLTTILVFVFLSLTSFSSMALNRLTASIDKNPVAVNQSFILTVQADAQVGNSALRTDSLLKDFVVGKVSAKSHTQIINSSARHATIWTIMLISRKAGRYTIPAFTIDNVSSQPISVTISNTSTKANKDVFLKTSVDKSTVYLQSSIQFTTKLYLAVDIQRGSLTEPVMENANIRQIGKDEELSDIQNGVRYRVIKRLYAITPQRSGTYSIKAPVFNGELVVNKRQGFFSGFNNVKPVSLIGDDIEITVKPIPDEYVGQWLPSELVGLHEEWQPNAASYTVGDPITRIITLTAIGVSEEQLPEITVTYPAQVKTYPDQSTLNSVNRKNKLVAQRKDSVALVPSKAGTLVLPEVRIPWWNTITNTMEFATLPAKTIEIKPSANANYTPLEPVQTPATAPVETPANISTEIKEVQVISHLTWLFLTAWILTTLLWLIHVRHLKNKGVEAKVTKAQTTASGRSYFTKFEAACKANDPANANAQLLRWGRVRWPEQSFTSTLEVALYLNSEAVVAAVKELQSHLYASQNKDWQGQELLAQVSNNKSPDQTHDVDGLNPLHPA